MFYLIKTPGWVKKLYDNCIWQIPDKDKTVYLTFDDGPHPAITLFVLDELKKYSAKATFFCVGKNVMKNQEVYDKIINEGHSTGNHTFDHINGWKTQHKDYLDNITTAEKYIDSKLFRPPYGKTTKFQRKTLIDQKYKIIMWSILSGDFDAGITAEKCYENVIRNIHNGAIVVFHDSEKAFDRLKFVLPKVLKLLDEKGYKCEAISAFDKRL